MSQIFLSSNFKGTTMFTFTRRAFIMNAPLLILSTKNIKTSVVNCIPESSIRKWENDYKRHRANENFYKASRKYYESLLSHDGHMSRDLVDSFRAAREIAQKYPDDKFYQEILGEMKNEVLEIRIFDNCMLG